MSETEAPTRPKPAALRPGDLERVRRYRPDVVEVTKVREADLSAALTFLPAELHAEAEERIRHALRGYLMNASSEHEPPEAVQARYFRVLEAQARELARLLLPRDDIEPKHWSALGMVSGAIASELSVRAGTKRPHLFEEIPRFMGTLARLRDAAEAAADSFEEKKKAGRPRGYRMAELLADLRPLWEAAANRERFIEACLAAIGESRGSEAVRKAVERFGQNR